MKESGKFVVRIDQSLHRELKDEAKKVGASLNQICQQRLAQKNEYDLSFLQKIDCNLIALAQYGSISRGDSTNSSDIDWMLVVHQDVKINRDLYRKIDQLSLPNKSVALSISHLPNLDSLSNFWLEISLDLQVLYDTKNMLKKRVIEIRRAIAAGLFQRYESHGQPYWINRGANEKSKACE